MASVTARLSLMGEDGYGEQEKDANSQLVELDKGLRSTKAGEQCEAIVRFPRLFEKYPFPILINSAALKLADVFRVGSNFLRLCILKVMQQSEKHLDKILNVDEFVRRIYMVIHSNDPVARAITLRTLGSCATVIAERKNVHHSIINGLDSRDSVELEAAIYAAARFAAYSKSFSGSISVKLTEMIEGLATPVEMKLKLIPTFQHMHHDANTASKIREFCTSLLPSYPARAFVLVTLHTLSQLAAKSLMDIPQQIDLLLDYLMADPRKSVKTLALQDMKLLARRAPHMWSGTHIKRLCQFTVETVYNGLKIGALNALSTLSSSMAVSKFDTMPDNSSVVLVMCSLCSYDSNIKIASRTAEVLTDIAIHRHKVKGSDSQKLGDDAAACLEALIIVATSEQSGENLLALKTCLHSVVQLCRSCPGTTDRFVDLMMSTLSSVSGNYSVLLCECLAALSSYRNDLLQSLVPDIKVALQQATKSPDQHKEKLMVCLLTLLFQACVDFTLPGEGYPDLLPYLMAMNCWNIYKVGRQAAHYGHHQAAAQIFKTLATKVSTEHYYFWLSALTDISLGENCLHDDITTMSQFMRQVTQAETHYHKAIVALKAAMTPSWPLDFQCRWMKLRAQLLQAQVQLVKACCSFQTSPPPAIATSLAMSTGQEVHRCAHIVAQLKKCDKQFEDLCNKYGDLYQSAFDADPTSLMSVQILQQSCQVVMHVLQTILNRVSKPDVKITVNTSIVSSGQHLLIEHQPWVTSCRQILELLHETVQQPSETPLTYQHIECIQKATMTLTQLPLCLPRFFFQSRQATNIKLAISPQPRSVNEPVSIHYDTRLTLKVEGVIQHGRQPGLFRKVHGVCISVRSTQTSRGQMIAETKISENPPNEMSQTVEPHNDYFSAQFLLAFPIAGLHVIHMDTTVVDETGATWRTGPKATLTVKSYDEAFQRQQQQQYAAQRQQQRVALASTSQF